MAIKSLIKRLLVYGNGRRQEMKLLDKEEQEWQEGASASQHESKEESCREELDRAIQMAECIYDLDGPDDLPENPELVEFLCAEPDKPPPEVQDPLDIIDLWTEEDPRPIQINGLLGVDDRARIICLLQEFKDCFAWHYTEMPGLDSTLVEHRMPIKEGYKPVKQAPRRMSKEIEEKVKEEIERLVKVGFIRPAKYVEWLANIVPILKAITKAVRCCVDYRNINSATPKDEYPMPMADLSINAVAKHKVLSFMDGNVGYNQIKMAPEDIHKIAFRCPGHVGAYEYLVMPFGLKNAGTTYQRAMNAIFHDLIGQSMEVYIDDIVVKSKTEEQHLVDLKQALTRMRIHKLKMNPKKCAFGVRAGNFLGFLVHQREKSIGSLLAQNNEGGNEQAVYYLSRILTEVETRYSPVERLCLALYFTASKLRHYMLPCHVHIIAKTDVIKYMLSKPMLTGMIGKWILALSEFSFQYVPQRAVKRQSIADFLTEHQESQSEKASGAGIVIVNPQGVYHYYSFLLDYQGNTNDRAEYEALIIGLEILMDLGAAEVEVFGDSELVINQLNGQEESMRVMAEVHEGICGAHQAGTKMRWLLKRYGYFWPDMEKYCKSYARGCEECQRHGPLQHVPSVPLNPVVKHWPFRGWAMDFIGQIYPASSKGHTFIIIATDYFTKWVEASAVKSITSAAVKNFIETKILHRYGVPETIVTDRGPSFISKEVEEFASKYKIKMIQSSPYYTQSNGQAKASNKILVNVIKRMVIDSPEKWHKKLGNTLWAYRTSKRAGTGTTSYALTFG
ncbi:unnamed protein product [Malus baccata var. baccata]